MHFTIWYHWHLWFKLLTLTALYQSVYVCVVCLCVSGVDSSSLVAMQWNFLKLYSYVVPCWSFYFTEKHKACEPTTSKYLGCTTWPAPPPPAWLFWFMCISPLMTARQLEAPEASSAWGWGRGAPTQRFTFLRECHQCLPHKVRINLKVLVQNSQNQLPLLSEIQSREAGGGRRGGRCLEDFLFLGA